MNLRVGLRGFVILRHDMDGRQRLLGLHGCQKFPEDACDLLRPTGEERINDLVVVGLIHGRRLGHRNCQSHEENRAARSAPFMPLFL